MAGLVPCPAQHAEGTDVGMGWAEQPWTDATCASQPDGRACTEADLGWACLCVGVPAAGQAAASLPDHTACVPRGATGAVSAPNTCYTRARSSDERLTITL